MPVLRASEIGVYLFCQRAWGYQQQGYPSANQESLVEGENLHRRHERQVLQLGCLRWSAAGLFLLALFLLTLHLLSH